MKEQIKALLAKYNLTVESVFIPWSRSRNKDEKMPSLNWSVTLLMNGRKILTTDYMAGCAHAPSYQQRTYNTIDGRESVLWECEHGYKQFSGSIGRMRANTRELKPDSHDVIYSLLLDSDVLNFSSMEEWAESCGFDPDSRKDEQIYNACMKIALQFRQIGESVISELREAYQDY